MIRHVVLVLFALAGCSAAPPTPPPVQAVSYSSGDPRTRMAEERKDEVIRRLSVCESGGHGPSDRPIYGGRGAFVGRLQFTPPTVIGYAMRMDGRVLTVREATELAHDYDQAAALAKFVIFELDGIWNWSLCNRKLGLAAEIKAIKQL